MRLLRPILLAAALALAAPLPATATSPAVVSSAEEIVTRADFALDSFLGALAPDDVTRLYVQNAYGVLVVPALIKGGFILGAEHGRGVLLVRDTFTGQFGPPTFFELIGGSIGLQAGGKSSDVLITVMNPQALERLLDGDVQIGGELSMAMIVVGGTFGAATTSAFGEDLYVFERTQGFFGGASIGGGSVRPLENLNASYWGDGTTTRAVAHQFDRVDARSANLRATLSRF